MSKRSASSQLTGSTQEGDPYANQDLMRDDDPVRQVSAAERAKRRIKIPKSRKFGTGSQQGSTIFPNPFANVESGQMNGSTSNSMPQPSFSFGSSSSFPPSNTSNFGLTTSSSASFPAPQNGGNTGFSFGSTGAAPPSAGFSFNVAGTNNPFSNMNGTNNNSSSTNGIGSSALPGSIFGSTSTFQHQPTTNGFGTNTPSNLFQNPNSFATSNDDGMQISPQASPAKKITIEGDRAPMFGTASASSPFQAGNLFGSKAQQNTSTLSQPLANPAPPRIFGQPINSTTSSSEPAVSSTAPAESFFRTTADNQTPPKTLFNPFQTKAVETPTATQVAPSTTPFNPFQSLAQSPAATEEHKSTSPFDTGSSVAPSFGNILQPKSTESPASNPPTSSISAPPRFQFSAPAPMPASGLLGNPQPFSNQVSPMKSAISASPLEDNTDTELTPPSSLSEEQKIAFYRHLELRSLNASFREFINKSDLGANLAQICSSYLQQSKKILTGDSSLLRDIGVKPPPGIDLSIPDNKKAPSLDASHSVSQQSPPKIQSQTSNLFKSIVDSNEPYSGGSTPTPPSKFIPTSINPSPAHTSSSPFTFKPSSGNSSSDDSTKIKPPSFGTGGGSVNFMAQFGKKAEQDALKAKQIRKDSDFDSDEEDEASWDEKDEEAQRKRKEELADIAKKNTVKFIPGKGFTFGGSSGNTSSQLEAAKPQVSGSLFNTSEGNSSTSANKNASIFDNQSNNFLKAPASNNIFAHLSDAESGAEGSKAGDADDEDTDFSGESEEDPQETSLSKSLNGPSQKRLREDESDDGDSLEDAIRRNTGRSPKKPTSDMNNSHGAGRSLFDRITPADTPAERSHNVSDDEAGAAPSSFGNAGRPNGTSVFSSTPSTQASNLFGNNTPTPGDHTWKPESPIKFGTNTNTSNTSAPLFNLIPATPTKSSQTPADKSLSGLFGATSGKPSFSLFNTSTTPTGSPAKPASEVGFSFGGPPKSLFSGGQNNLFNSGASSRATSPGGETSAAESTDGGDTEVPADPQCDLTSLSDTEKRDNDVLFESLKVKCLQFDPTSEKKWEARGVGPLRVLKSKETGIATILCRASPSGKIVLNSRLLQGIEYKRVQKGVVRITVTEKDGTPCAWMVRVGTDEVADKLAAVLMENRPK